MKDRIEKPHAARYWACLPLALLALWGWGAPELGSLSAGGTLDGEGKSSAETQMHHVGGNSHMQGPAAGQGGKPVQWQALDPPSETEVRIGNNVGWCPGFGPFPRISGVRQVSTPKAVILTAYFVNPPPRSKPGRPACPGVEALIERVVHIRGGLGDRPLYDGSQSPPKKRWPRD
jgi:hypothetical protein